MGIHEDSTTKRCQYTTEKNESILWNYGYLPLSPEKTLY